MPLSPGPARLLDISRFDLSIDPPEFEGLLSEENVLLESLETEVGSAAAEIQTAQVEGIPILDDVFTAGEAAYRELTGEGEFNEDGILGPELAEFPHIDSGLISANPNSRPPVEVYTVPPDPREPAIID